MGVQADDEQRGAWQQRLPGVIETPLLTDFNSTMSEPLLDWMISQGNGQQRHPRADRRRARLSRLGCRRVPERRD